MDERKAYHKPSFLEEYIHSRSKKVFAKEKFKNDTGIYIFKQLF